MNTTQSNLIYLLSCSVNGITPDAERAKAADLERLYRLAKFHSVRAAVCIALKRAGIEDNQFDQAYKKAVRKNIYLDMERSAIQKDFEKHGIWYMPLKGSVLKDLYLENGMREMADNDVLFDGAKQQEVMQIMLEHGYSAEYVGKSNHDVYHKPPVLNFELHTALFGEAHAEPLYKYYQNIKRSLIKDDGSEFGYHFSDEDFYVYITAHEWKHYNLGGTGMRSLLDCYVYCKVKGDSLDWNYITEQCKKLEISDFEQKRRELAIKVLSSGEIPELSENEQKMLMYYMTAGTYGTVENSVKKELQKQTKLKFILKSLFPNLDFMKRSVDFVGKYPVLYPLGIVYRWGRILAIRRSYLKTIMKVIKKSGKKK